MIKEIAMALLFMLIAASVVTSLVSAFLWDHSNLSYTQVVVAKAQCEGQCVPSIFYLPVATEKQ